MNQFDDVANMASLLRKAVNDASISVLSQKRIDEGLGFTSYIYRVSLADNDRLPKSILVKIPTVAKLEGIDIRVIYTHHNIEVNFYDMVGRLDTARLLRIPRSFGSLKHLGNFDVTPFLLMEDLSGVARVPDYMTESFNLAQIGQMIEFLASLHAFSLTHSHWNAEGNFAPPTTEGLQLHISIGKTAVTTLRTRYPEEFTLTDAQLALLFDLKACGEGLKDPNTSATVIVHGDLWAANILFQKSPGGKGLTDELVGVVDWQTLYPGHCGTDLARLLIANVDFRLRRQHETQLIADYYQCLKAKLPENFTMPWDLEAIGQLYRKALRFASLEFLLNVPFSFVAAPWSDDVRLEFVRRVVANVEDALAAVEV